MVVPCRANSRTSSPGGMGVLPPPSRVSTTDCATSGMVSSRCASAATAENDDTPGTTSVAIPIPAHRSSCSCVPPHRAGSPEWIRATFKPCRYARSYTATTSSSDMAAESRIRAPSRAWSRTSACTRLAAQITTSASAMARAARNVSRSAAPGPAPTKVTLPVGAPVGAPMGASTTASTGASTWGADGGIGHGDRSSRSYCGGIAGGSVSGHSFPPRPPSRRAGAMRVER